MNKKGFSLIEVIIFLVILAITIAITIPHIINIGSNANVVSKNISTAADQFEINRRIVFYNGITGEYILCLEGLCSLGNYDKQRELSVTCKVGPDTYKKHFLGLSDNVTYFAEQIDPQPVNSFRYRVIFKPEVIIPDIDIVTSKK